MRSFLPIALTYLLLRALLLWSNFDAVCMPNYELAPMGQLAWSGGGLPPELPLGRFYDNCGGHLVTGLLASPLYALADDRYMALKLVPLLFGLATLTLLWRGLDRHFGRRTASAFGWAFAIGTPALLQTSLIAMGNHYEGLLAQAWILVAFLDARARPEPRRCLVFGLALGLGAFLYFGTLALSVPACAVFFLPRRRRTLPLVRSVVGGAALGGAPLLWAQLASGAKPGLFLERVFGGSAGTPLAEAQSRVADLVVERLPRAGSSPGLLGVDGAWFDFLFTALAAVAWIAALAGLRTNRRLAPVVLYVPFVIVVVAFSRLVFHDIARPLEAVGRRYLLSFQLFELVLLAALVGSSRTPRAARVALVAGFALVGLSGLGHLRLQSGETGHAWRYAGVHHPYWAAPLMRDALLENDVILARLERLPAEARGEAARGLGHHLGWLHLAPLPARQQVPRAVELLDPWPADLQLRIARGFGSFWRTLVRMDGSVAPAFDVVVSDLEQLPAPLRAAVGEGLALEFEYPLARLLDHQFARTRAILGALPAGLEPAVWRGHGEACGAVLARGLASDQKRFAAALVRVPSTSSADFLTGALSGWSRVSDAPAPDSLTPAAGLDLPEE